LPATPTPDSAAGLVGHILVVDDEPDIVEFTVALLTNMGCQATGATTANDAWRIFEANPAAFDMVISDVTMPDVTGIELARSMIERRPELPVVLVTGYSGADSEEAARRLGIRRILQKPVPSRLLGSVVAQCLAATATSNRTA
jgi:DNA-binding NtrC family response regulator